MSEPNPIQASADGLARLNAWLGRREKLLLLAILALGALLRLAYWAEVRQQPDYRAPVLDALYHDYWARALLTGNWLPPEGQPDPEIRQNPYVRPPLYPYALFGVYALSGLSYDAPRAIQFLLGLFSAWLAGRLARRWIGTVAGLITTALLCGYWSMPYYEAQLVEPSVVIPLMLGVVAVTAGWASSARIARLFLGGLLLGLLILARPNALLLIPVIGGWIGWVGWRAAYPRGILLRGVGAFVLAAALGILPAIWRNYVVSNELIPVTAVGGQNLYLANNEMADGFTGIAPDIRSWSSFDHARLVRALGNEIGRPLTYGEASSVWRERALRFMREHPDRVVKLLVRKFLLLWGPLEVSVDREDELERRASPILRYNPFRFSLVLALALTGMFMLSESWSAQAPGQRRVWWLLGGIVLVYAFSYLPFTVTGRYRVPLVPLLVLPASYALARWTELVAQRRGHAALGWAAAALVIGLVVSRNFTGYAPSAAKYNLAQGLAYGRAGLTDQALPWFAEAVRLKPDFADARLNYGVALSRTGNLADAAREIEEAARQEPNPRGWQMVGRVRRQLGDRAGADAAYREAIRLNDSDASIWNELGILQGESGDAEQAAASFARAVERAPNYFDARVNLGRARMQQGRTAEAAREFDAALRLNPRAGAVAYDLAKLRGLEGRYEEAVALLYQALESGQPEPEWIGALAWVRAAHPSPALRDGAEAVFLAQQLLRMLGEREPTALVVAAAAAAEAGRFEDARTLIGNALRILPSDAEPGMRRNLSAQQDAYRADKAYRDTSMVSGLTTK